jgi:hypothetical protein
MRKYVECLYIDFLFFLPYATQEDLNMLKAYGGVGVKIHIFLSSTLAGGERSASRPEDEWYRSIIKRYLFIF